MKNNATIYVNCSLFSIIKNFINYLCNDTINDISMAPAVWNRSRVPREEQRESRREISSLNVLTALNRAESLKPEAGRPARRSTILSTRARCDSAWLICRGLYSAKLVVVGSASRIAANFDNGVSSNARNRLGRNFENTSATYFVTSKDYFDVSYFIYIWV